MVNRMTVAQVFLAAAAPSFNAAECCQSRAGAHNETPEAKFDLQIQSI